MERSEAISAFHFTIVISIWLDFHKYYTKLTLSQHITCLTQHPQFSLVPEPPYPDEEKDQRKPEQDTALQENPL